MSEKIWQEYLSEIGKKSRPQSDESTELPAECWNWGQLGDKNRAKKQAERAFELDLLTYFLSDSTNFASKADYRKIGNFFPADSEKGIKIFTALQAASDALKDEQTDAMIAAALTTHKLPPFIKEETKISTAAHRTQSITEAEQFKIRMEKFKEKMKAVKVFVRCYDTAIVTSWVDSICNVFSSPLARSWFETNAEGIAFVKERVDAACLEWIRSLPPPSTALELIETIRINHWPKRDIEDARDALEKMRFLSYGLDRNAVYSFHQSFQALLPRCKYTDNLSLRRVYQVAIGKEFFSEILTNDRIAKDETYDVRYTYTSCLV